MLAEVLARGGPVLAVPLDGVVVAAQEQVLLVKMQIMAITIARVMVAQAELQQSLIQQLLQT